MKITYKQIKSFSPCYKPGSIGIMSDYEATIPDFINEYRYKVNNLSDIMWTLCRHDFMTDKELRLFAVWSARQVQHLMTDQRSFAALDIAEKYANGNATQEELAAAGDAARAAARDTRDAARDAARAAARAAAWDAARDAAWDAAGDAAWDAAWDAWDAAGDAARSAQIDYLLNLFESK